MRSETVRSVADCYYLQYVSVVSRSMVSCLSLLFFLPIFVAWNRANSTRATPISSRWIKESFSRSISSYWNSHRPARISRIRRISADWWKIKRDSQRFFDNQNRRLSAESRRKEKFVKFRSTKWQLSLLKRFLAGSLTLLVSTLQSNFIESDPISFLPATSLPLEPSQSFSISRSLPDSIWRCVLQESGNFFLSRQCAPR